MNYQNKHMVCMHYAAMNLILFLNTNCTAVLQKLWGALRKRTAFHSKLKFDQFALPLVLILASMKFNIVKAFMLHFKDICHF